MLKLICRSIRGCFITVAMLLSWLFFTSLVVISGCCVCLVTLSKRREKTLAKLAIIGLWWARSCHYLLLFRNKSRWNIDTTDSLSQDEWYLLISNHQSWADILILNVAFGRSIPIFKYFLKKQLLWQLPVGGLSCWMLGFPLVSRYSKKKMRKDPKLAEKTVKSLSQACDKLSLCPTTTIIFPEGTRHSEEKSEKQRSPYKHLLKPKTQGIALVVNALPKTLKTMLNVSICHEPKKMSMWDLMSGNYHCINVSLSSHPITDAQRGDFYKDRNYRKSLQEWLNKLWAEKDEHIATMASKHHD